MGTIKLSNIPKQVTNVYDLDGSELFIVSKTENGVMTSEKLSFSKLKDYINPSSSQFTLTLNTSTNPTSETGGTVTGAGSYNHGSSVTIKATVTNSNYDFDGWYDGNTLISSDAQYTFTLNSNVTYTAKFTRCYTITFNAGNYSYSDTKVTYSSDGYHVSTDEIPLVQRTRRGEYPILPLFDNDGYFDVPVIRDGTVKVQRHLAFKQFNTTIVTATTDVTYTAQYDLAVWFEIVPKLNDNTSGGGKVYNENGIDITTTGFKSLLIQSGTHQTGGTTSNKTQLRAVPDSNRGWAIDKYGWSAESSTYATWEKVDSSDVGDKAIHCPNVYFQYEIAYNNDDGKKVYVTFDANKTSGTLVQSETGAWRRSKSEAERAGDSKSDELLQSWRSKEPSSTFYSIIIIENESNVYYRPWVRIYRR